MRTAPKQFKRIQPVSAKGHTLRGLVQNLTSFERVCPKCGLVVSELLRHAHPEQVAKLLATPCIPTTSK